MEWIVYLILNSWSIYIVYLPPRLRIFFPSFNPSISIPSFFSLTFSPSPLPSYLSPTTPLHSPPSSHPLPHTLSPLHSLPLTLSPTPPLHSTPFLSADKLGPRLDIFSRSLRKEKRLSSLRHLSTVDHVQPEGSITGSLMKTEGTGVS